MNAKESSSVMDPSYFLHYPTKQVITFLFEQSNYELEGLNPKERMDPSDTFDGDSSPDGHVSPSSSCCPCGFRTSQDRPVHPFGSVGLKDTYWIFAQMETKLCANLSLLEMFLHRRDVHPQQEEVQLLKDLVSHATLQDLNRMETNEKEKETENDVELYRHWVDQLDFLVNYFAYDTDATIHVVLEQDDMVHQRMTATNMNRNISQCVDPYHHHRRQQQQQQQQKMQSFVTRLLQCIAYLYELVLPIEQERLYKSTCIHSEENISHLAEEDIAELYLDWALACKRASFIPTCIHAHLQRMQLCPHYVQTDAIRLLGYQSDLHSSRNTRTHISGSTNDTGSTTTLRMNSTGTTFVVIPFDSSFSEVEDTYTGIFQIENDEHSTLFRPKIYYPSTSAIELGTRIRRLFAQAQYTLSHCTSKLLVPLLPSSPFKNYETQLFSAQSFFHHRHELWDWDQNHNFVQQKKKEEEEEEEDPIPNNNTIPCHPTIQWTSFDVLARLFLFGIAVPYSNAWNCLGPDSIDLLMEASLLQWSPTCSSDVVGTVQIYPVSPKDLFLGDFCKMNPDQEDYDTCLIMTDWPMESLRSQEHAVMSVGYDTLELMSLTTGWMVQQSSLNVVNIGRILDLCCGSGIQGIFLFFLENYCNKSLLTWSPVQHEEIVCLDINIRACHFVSANISLNALASRMNENDDGVNDSMFDVHRRRIYARQSNIYQPILLTHCDPEHELDSYDIGTFGCILCNPPFVAVPNSIISSLKPPLYSVGGGVAGTHILQEILMDCFSRLSLGPKSILLMVTELHNIEQSELFLRDMLPESERMTARIRIAYIEDDVETINHYVNARKSETGVPLNVPGWEECVLKERIRNRALALITITRDRGDRPLRNEAIRKCSSHHKAHLECAIDPVDEEDMFLTKYGADFARESLLK